MNEIIAKKSKTGKEHIIPLCLDRKKTFTIKFDPGANHTVISLDCLMNKPNKHQREEFLRKIESNNNIIPHKFTSASGGTFDGYLVHAKNIVLGNETFSDFYYYLILENKRIIALLGEDFLDNCDYNHSMHSDIIISAFDSESYTANKEQFISNEDILTYVDEIVQDTATTKTNTEITDKVMRDGLNSIAKLEEISNQLPTI